MFSWIGILIELKIQRLLYISVQKKTEKKKSFLDRRKGRPVPRVYNYYTPQGPVRSTYDVSVLVGVTQGWILINPWTGWS